MFLKNFNNTTTFAVEPCDNFADKTNRLGYKTYVSFWNNKLSKNMEKHIKQSKGLTENIKPISLGQIW